MIYVGYLSFVIKAETLIHIPARVKPQFLCD